MPTRKRLLFVDDEPSIRLTLPAVLEDHGFAVTTAESVPDAIARIDRAQFDVLLSDLNIGQEGDGFQVVSAMRKRHPQCVNIILTGYPAFESAVLAIRHQVDDYVVKPADIDALVRTIKHKLSELAGRERLG
ncbi:MAG TPA: response regulator [Terriglobales bacterium]|jgi:DNA-binding NtrC family response regulator|nr:response regulator [Terriglobales bacterium]